MKSLVVIVLFLYFCSAYSNYINDKKCGLIASENPIHQHPWLSLIEFYRGGRRALMRCGGTLIDSQYIITTAHCVEIIKNNTEGGENQSSMTILPRLGEYNMSSHPDCVAGVCSEPFIRMVVDRIIVHPWFYRDNVSHDLAILVLETEAPYTDFIRPVCLPRRILGIPTELYASGFGKTPSSEQQSQIKKNIRLPYYPTCPKIYEQIYDLPEDGFCAGGEENLDTCIGDSGGPIVWVKEYGGYKRAVLWGVIKGGTEHCGSKGKPGVYTSVLKNLLWIEEVIGITSIEQQNNGTQSSEENDNEGNKNKENQNEENQNGENGEKQDKEKHRDFDNSGQIRCGSAFLLLLMMLLSVLWL